MKNLKGLLLAALVLFAMSSCVQEDSISQVEEDDCGCNGEISGRVTDKVADPYADTNGYHYILYVRGCGEDVTVSSERHTVTEAIYNNFSVGSDICAN